MIQIRHDHIPLPISKESYSFHFKWSKVISCAFFYSKYEGKLLNDILCLKEISFISYSCLLLSKYFSSDYNIEILFFILLQVKGTLVSLKREYTVYVTCLFIYKSKHFLKNKFIVFLLSLSILYFTFTFNSISIKHI